MLEFTLMTDKDRQEAATLERRRAAEEERKSRIFNPKQRLFGIDYEALIQQTEEKKKREMEEKRVNEIFDAQLQRNGQIALALQVKENEERLKVQKEINDFRANFQKFEDRREFDLNDPNWRKKLLPARLHDDDPRCGISSAQKFEGEDLASEARAKVQKEQYVSWLEQQVAEREEADKSRKMAEEAYRAAVIARDQRAIELDVMEKDCRKRLDLACGRFNKALADERYCKEKECDRQEKEDTLAQMYNTMTSDMMTENPDVSMSNLGASRRIGYLYKGMSPEEQKAVRVYQLSQIEENKKRREQEARFNREWDDYINGSQRCIALMDLDLKRKQQEANKKLAEENRKMGEEHKNHQEYLQKIVYRNKPTAAFYEQFNKSAR